MVITDTTGGMLASFDAGSFHMERWAAYIDASVPGARALCLGDMRECIAAGCSWENDYLPVLDSVARNTAQREEAIASFHAVTAQLDGKIVRRFGRSVDADVILYLGLCNGAGWVTPINGKTAVLLGIEKIMELGWSGIDDMTGLILHELGHVYQSQYGVLRRETDAQPERFLWQLFTEGIAMVFEQEIVGDPAYYHQDRDGWKQWCEQNAERIRGSFRDDLAAMTFQNQRYFGDWVRFEGHGDTGYFLGTKFIRHLLNFDRFDRIIGYGMEDVKAGFEEFMRADLQSPEVR